MLAPTDACLGAVLLLFWVGPETKLDDLREVGATAGLVGLLGVVLPFAGGRRSRIAIAGVALAEKAVSEEFIAIGVGMSVLTTLIAPHVLRAVSRPEAQS